jgi:hypothetical protein
VPHHIDEDGAGGEILCMEWARLLLVMRQLYYSRYEKFNALHVLFQKYVGAEINSPPILL